MPSTVPSKELEECPVDQFIENNTHAAKMVFVDERDRQRIIDEASERNLTVLVNESSVPKLRALT